VRLGGEGYPCFRVAEVDPPRTLVLIGADPQPPHAVGAADNGMAATWQWCLRPQDGGLRTRLLVRQRLRFPPSQRFMWRVVDTVGFVMERRMLHGIRHRAEARDQRHRLPGRRTSVRAPASTQDDTSPAKDRVGIEVPR
jgi:hypothetical protein